MPKKIDLYGKKFGRWTVIDSAVSDGSGAKWICRCDCGKEASVKASSLISGRSKSCGCYKSESMRTRAETHGHARVGKRTPTYQTWRDMMRRCDSPKHRNYSTYGGKGIKVCKKWRKFENFLSDMGERPDKNTLDRINSNGDYCKSNCRWATAKEQARNMSSNHYIEHNSKRMIIADWATETGIKEGTIRARISRGWSYERALTK